MSSTAKRVVIVGPPYFWRAAFAEVRRRGDRVVRLVLPPAVRGDDQLLRSVLDEMQAGEADELLLDLTTPA